MIDVDAYTKGVLDGKRAVIARAITLVESTRPQHRALAQELLTALRTLRSSSEPS